MNNLYLRETWNAVRNYECPRCIQKPFYKEGENMIQINENLIYSHCPNCRGYFKFIRRELNDLNINCELEYAIHDNKGKIYGIRGYIIKPETYKKYYAQYIKISNYFSFGIYEIDDLFKEDLKNKNESIYDFVSPAFNDEEYYKRNKKYKNWHCNINDEITNERLLNNPLEPIPVREIYP